MLDYADFIVLNKSDRIGSKDAFQDVQKIYRNIHNIFNIQSNKLPVFLTNTRYYNNLDITSIFQNLFKYIYIKPSKAIPIYNSAVNNLSFLYRNNYLKYIV